jgi:hypothetical protein
MRLSQSQIDSLRAAVMGLDFARQVAGAVERCCSASASARRAAATWAEQVLIAEMALRHRGQFEGLYLSLRRLQGELGSWSAAVGELADRLYRYYATPLGAILCRELFADDAVHYCPSVDAPGARPTEDRTAAAAAAP